MKCLVPICSTISGQWGYDMAATHSTSLIGLKQQSAISKTLLRRVRSDVMKYSPEPQKIVEEDFTFEDQEVIIIMDSSEEEELDGTHQAPFGHIGYELLPQEAPQVDNADSDSGNSSDAIPQVSTQVNGTSDNVADTVESPMTPECTNRTRPEMEINADEVREAMRNVTLPQSSFPSWVSSIPESELNEFVSTRLARRLNDHQVNGDIPPP